MRRRRIPRFWWRQSTGRTICAWAAGDFQASCDVRRLQVHDFSVRQADTLISKIPQQKRSDVTSVTVNKTPQHKVFGCYKCHCEQNSATRSVRILQMSLWTKFRNTKRSDVKCHYEQNSATRSVRMLSVTMNKILQHEVFGYCKCHYEQNSATRCVRMLQMSLWTRPGSMNC